MSYSPIPPREMAGEVMTRLALVPGRMLAPVLLLLVVVVVAAAVAAVAVLAAAVVCTASAGVLYGAQRAIHAASAYRRKEVGG
ncbi:hypothetical protein [Streptomyces abyssomicinicus]|uniref:hypothetical protein n=1 Tax=Streptomyces abyssomicinicus TaxID=574929 RepID=UPI00124FA9F2|nr:hypothetical protein [Streptomyces abyssomicinicus]